MSFLNRSLDELMVAHILCFILLLISKIHTITGTIDGV